MISSAFFKFFFLTKQQKEHFSVLFEDFLMYILQIRNYLTAIFLPLRM